jgi:hypothetical protein
MHMDDDTAGQHIVWQSPLSDDGWTDEEPPVDHCAISAPVSPPRRRFGRRFGRVLSSISRSSGRRQPRSGERHRIVLNDEPTLRCPSRSRASSGRRSRKGPPDRPGSAFHRSGEMDAAPVRHSPSPASTSGRGQPIFITSDAVEFLSQSAPATVLRNHPGTFHVWRIMAHVLIMSAFQLRHPVTFFVQMKSSDLSPHCRRIAPSQMVLWLILAAVIKRRLRTVRGV